MSTNFAHLHVHSEYSLLDGAIKIDDLVKRVVSQGQTSVAITDHGWIAGAVRFTKAAKKAGIKPIIGMETYVATSDDHTKAAKSGGDNYHLTLLAANREGYLNLMALTSKAHLYGLSYKPRVDYSLLESHNRGVICLSGCVGAHIPQLLVAGAEDKARRLAERYQAIWGERFFIEVMSHGSTGGTDHVHIEEGGELVMTESDLNAALVSLANKLGVGIVATNDAHYLTRQDGDAHDTLLCIGMGAWKEKEDRMKFPGQEHQAWEFYIKSKEEMLEVNDEPWWDTACSNTSVVSDMIESDVIQLGQSIMPKFEIPNDPEFEKWLAQSK
jgi:DNA polymerase III subunit alpha